MLVYMFKVTFADGTIQRVTDLSKVVDPIISLEWTICADAFESNEKFNLPICRTKTSFQVKKSIE